MDKKWKGFFIDELFDVVKGTTLTKANYIDGNIPFISASKFNNSISAFVGNNNKSKDKNFISINNNGSVCENFYHPYEALVCGDVSKLKLKDRELNKYIALFLTTAISKQKDKYNYGYKSGKNRINRQLIYLPVNDKDEPDYDFMSCIIQDILNDKLKQYKQFCNNMLQELGEYKSIETLSSKSCKPFFITDIFDIPKRGKRIIAENYIHGDMPVVSSAGGNNGVIAFAGNRDKVRIYEDCLSVANGGVSAGFAFYHPYQFIATDHVTHFKGKLTKYHYMFLGTIIKNQLHEKYDFNREMTDPRLKREKLLVPITKEGKPDFDYMEQYIKNLIIAKCEAYLNFKRIKR